MTSTETEDSNGEMGYFSKGSLGCRVDSVTFNSICLPKMTAAVGGESPPHYNNNPIVFLERTQGFGEDSNTLKASVLNAKTVISD